MAHKNTIKFFTLFILSIFLISCNIDEQDVWINYPPTSTFKLNDTLKVADADSTGAFAEQYHYYNGKTYELSSTNALKMSFRENGGDVELYFEDSSKLPLKPALKIVLKNTGFQGLKSSYNLTNTSEAEVTASQTFSDGFTATGANATPVDGVLQISFNPRLKTLSGKIINLKIPLGYYVPEELPATERSANGPLLFSGGSLRTINLKFDSIGV